MYIETEDTPNPATLKFLPGRSVAGHCGPLDFADVNLAREKSPLAEALLGIPNVISVFLGAEFISVTKSVDESWTTLRAKILDVISSFYESGRTVLRDHDSLEELPVSGEDGEIIARIRDLLNTRVRPAVASDGGDIAFRGYRDGIVQLTMHGACAGCPSSRATLKHGVENMLRHYIPEIIAVEQVES